ncbi:hypothetical protein G9A89_022730 [Geosiphon pyriformis]|nr:hypothetical protein G9A89_022730 [Geosiphon pyriformis]
MVLDYLTKKKVVLRNVPKLWQYQYLLLDYVNNNAFSGVMNAIGYDELLHVVKNLPDNKAADLSGITNELWKHCNSSVLSLLLILLNLCLVHESEGVLTNTKPIVLIKTAHKILSKILSDKILLTCSMFDVLHGDNFSVLKDTITQSSIFAIGSVVENALKKDNELWLVLQDMHKAYNSMDWFFGNIHNDHVMIDFGLTNEYWVKRQESLCDYWINTKFVAKTNRLENQNGLTLFLVTGAFVDDTIWVGNSRATTQYILDIASEFFKINNISINNEKTVAIPINQRVSNASLLISGLPISVAHKGESYRYLGIYLLSKGLSLPSLAKAHSDVRFFVNLVLRKAILDKQFFYLVSAMLQLIISYRMQFTLHHLFLYDLKSFEQLQSKFKLASVLNFLNAGIIFGRLFNHRSLDLQVLSWLLIHLLCYLVKLHVNPVNNFLASVIKIFLNCDMSLSNFFFTAFHFIGALSLVGSSHVIGLQSLNDCGLGGVSRLRQCLSATDLDVINVYMNGSLRNLGFYEMKCGAAAYFSDLDLSIGIGIGGLAIVLALECVPLDSSVATALDACIAELALIKRHSGVLDNKHADVLASLAAGSNLVLPILIKEKYIKTDEMGVFSNIQHIEVGPSSNVVNKNLVGNMNWIHTALIWHSNSHIMTGFTCKSMANLHSYFLKALHHYLPVAVQKCLYNRAYPSVLCLYCKEVESSDHLFVCLFNFGAHKDLLALYLANWYVVSSLGVFFSQVLQMLSLCASDNVLYITVSKSFLFKKWFLEVLSIFDDAKAKYMAFMEKSGLISHDVSAVPVVYGLLYLFLAGVVKLLGIAEALGICFGFHKHCCFFAGIDSIVMS